MLSTYPDHMSSIKKPTIELKELPNNLRYKLLDEEINRPVIVNANLNSDEIDQLLEVLRKYHAALSYTISDLKGISPSACMH